MSICEMVKTVKLYWACTVLSLYSSIQDSVFVISYSEQCSGVCSDLCSKAGGSICLGYMCIHIYVKLIWCSGVAWIND